MDAYDLVAEARFMAKVDKQDNGCWIWTGASSAGSTNPQRYPMFHYRRMVRAHRWSYERWAGPIPEGLWIDHLCRVTMCVNPEHLEPVTPRENILRGEGVAAKEARQTHCKKGHEFTPENTLPQSRVKGKARRGRACRICKNEWMRKNRPSRAKRQF